MPPDGGFRPTGWLRRPEARWGIAVAAFGLIERWLVGRFYQPISYGDTAPYLRLANDLLTRGLGGYDGTRVPGYPIFLLLLRMDPSRVWLAQLAIGWGISLLLFWIGWRTSGSALLGASLALIYDLTPGLFFFESNLLSETLATFLAILTLAVYAGLDRSPEGARRVGLALVLGVVASVAALTRALFFLLPAWLLPFVWLMPERPAEAAGAVVRWKSRLIRTGAFALAPLVLLGGWLGWVYSSYGMLSPDTMGGYHLVNHAGAYFEDLPDEDAVIRDTYLRYREAQMAETGNQTNAIYDAIPELTQVSGLSFFDLSRELQRLSIRLIRAHPGRYLRDVVDGWIDFWRAPIFWRPDLLTLGLPIGVLNGAAIAARLLSVGANLAFLAMSAAAVASRRIRASLGLDRLTIAWAGLVWAVSIIQALVEHGDNPRWLMPLQMIVFCVVLRGVWAWRNSRMEMKA